MKYIHELQSIHDFWLVSFILQAVLGLYCYLQGFSSCGEQELLFILVHGLLIAMASLFAEQGLWACRLRWFSMQAQSLQLTGPRMHKFQQLSPVNLIVVAQGLSCPVSRAIFLDQGSNPCPMLSSALASRVLTTEPLGKPQYCPTTPKLISLSGTQFSTKKHFSNALNLKHKSIHSGLPLLMCIELFFLYELIRKIIWICFVIHASLKLYSH